MKAQFSIPYTIASALVNGDVFIDQVSSQMDDPRVLALADKVQVEPLPEVGDKMTFVPIVLQIRMVSGEEHSIRRENLKGTPSSPMTWDEIVSERLMRCAAHGGSRIEAGRIDRIIQFTKDLDNSVDATEVMALVS